MKKPSIPDIPPSLAGDQYRFQQAVKETVESITGRRGQKVKALPASATAADCAAKINEILEVLQG